MFHVGFAEEGVFRYLERDSALSDRLAYKDIDGGTHVHAQIIE
jgi:hypothetical protein